MYWVPTTNCTSRCGKKPNFTVTLPVRPDGKISLPLINDIQAAGLTPMQLRESITEKLKKYIADPRVTVVVTAMISRRIFVSGEVLHTGAMPLLPNMTMLQALAAAGFTQFANLKGIYVLRIENGKQVKLPFNYRQVIKGNHPEQNIHAEPGRHSGGPVRKAMSKRLNISILAVVVLGLCAALSAARAQDSSTQPAPGIWVRRTVPSRRSRKARRQTRRMGRMVQRRSRRTLPFPRWINPLWARTLRL